MKEWHIDQPVWKTIGVYYGFLQTIHITALLFSLLAISTSGKIPLAPSPAGGWSSQALPFLIGMGAVDAAAAGLGIYFAVQLYRNQVWKKKLALISLTAASTSALIFAAGTIASGAWSVAPGVYLLMVVLFSPLVPFYWMLIQSN